MNLVLKILICVIYGALIGLLSIPIAKKLILKRSDDPGDTIVLNDRLRKAAVILSGAAVGAVMAVTIDDVSLLIRNLVLLFPMLCIAIIDILIRKIPNPLLLAMIGIQAVYLTYYSVVNHTTSNLITAGFGFFIGFFCCTVPSILKIPVGAGDIKYSAVIGLCIYFGNYLQAMIIMGLLALGFYLILKVTKKGGMKTLVPMGPFLSIGAVISMCFPVINNLIEKVGMF